ncbi:type IV secretory system conjugative DNA transfer family protein [Nocardia wallacei]|uniref:type IV secretory system conjugative DNA transfer family protein n=1 Tax=Nocardia wallacei TaxID=480035 RepID=UPI00245826CE|nr:TraM recognition domain-containing protein [Nocardia wallacei]
MNVRNRLRRRPMVPDRRTVRVGVLAADPRSSVCLSPRDGVIVYGPTGSGKTWRLAYQRVYDAPGFVAATSTKTDLMAATFLDRAAQGRIAVFDPEDLSGWPGKIRWSLLSGCADPDVAIRRAEALTKAMPLEGTKNGGYFESKAATLLRCYLHAAALDDRSIRDVRVWVPSRTNRTAVDILGAHLPDWAAELEQILGSSSESSDDVLAAAARLLEPLASPKMLAAVDVPAAESFEVESFVLDTAHANTLYLLSKGTSQSMAPFVAALAAEVHHVADRASQKRPGKRIDPPVRLVLDEVNNVAPIPELPSIMTDSGGKGITVWAFAHNQSQNEMRWGQIGGRMLGQSPPAMLLLPGLRGDELEAVSRLLGQRKRWEASLSRTMGRSYQQRDEPVLRADEIRELDHDQGLLIYRHAPAAVLRLPSVWDDPHTQRQVRAALETFETLVAAGELPPHLRLDAQEMRQP